MSKPSGAPPANADPGGRDWAAAANARRAVVSHAAVLGRSLLPPGIFPVNVAHPAGECLVAHAYPPTAGDPRRGFEIDVSDCTLFTVTHLTRETIDLTKTAEAFEVMEQALQAISAFIIWSRSGDQVGETTAFTRQIGRTDLKFFLVVPPTDELIVWRNPLFDFDRRGSALMAGLLSNMVVRNGPATNPVHPIRRRIMAAIDLINLGFYTESFVTLFSLTDDLAQEVLKAGLASKGIEGKAQEDLLRAIKEQRLRIFLTHLCKLCDWKALDSDNPALFKNLMKVNTLRNHIMHGADRLSREQAIGSCEILLQTIAWLQTNPFNVFIPPFPVLKLAEGKMVLLPTPPAEERKEQGAPEVDPDRPGN